MTDNQLGNKLPVASLLEKVYSYIDHYAIHEQTLTPLDKFHGVGLIADIFEKVKALQNGRTEYLESYFGGDTLRVNLEAVVGISDVKNTIEGLSYQKGVYEAPVTIESYSSVFDTGGTKELMDAEVWVAELESDNPDHHFESVFSVAHEKLDEPAVEEQINAIRKQVTSKDDLLRIRAMQKKLLKNQIAVMPQKVEPSKKFDFSGNILNIYKQLENVSAEDIFSEMAGGMELLRQVFMLRAQDILLIRKGETKIEGGLEDACLEMYYDVRQDRIAGIKEDIKNEFGSWRINNNKTGSSILIAEETNFLKAEKANWEKEMRESYPELWVVREHSGGLDAAVTKENFARMFYKRDNVNYDFLEMEWRLEVYDELIAENEQKRAFETIVFSPEEDAVNTFVDNIMKVTNILYTQYEGKMVPLGAHKPTILIHIDPVAVQSYLDDERAKNYEVFKAFCYPKDSRSNIRFGEYVTKLMDEELLGKLPKTIVGAAVAEVIAIASTTAQNYLSPKD